MRKPALSASLLIGVMLIVGGAATWLTVSSILAEQQITVSGDTSCLAGDEVNGPFSAYCEAKVIELHALDTTGGLTHAELDREDPLREVAMEARLSKASHTSPRSSPSEWRLWSSSSAWESGTWPSTWAPTS